MTQQSKKLSYVDKLNPEPVERSLSKYPKSNFKMFGRLGKCAGQKQTSDFNNHDVI